MTDATVIVVPDTVAPVETPVVAAVAVETAAIENAVEEVADKVDALIAHKINEDNLLVLSSLGELRSEMAAKFDQLFTMVGDIAAATVVIAEAEIADEIAEVEETEVVTEAIQEEAAVVEEVQERQHRRSRFIS